MNWPSALARMSKGGIGTALLVFGAILVLLFYGVFLPDQTLFSNDGPLGRLMSQCNDLPGRFLGCWADLNNIGFNGGTASPGISFSLQWLLGPVWFSKLYAIVSLLILGLGAWCFFRQSRLAPVACLLGGLATMLNSTFFCVACWGIAAHDIAAGMVFFALAGLADPASRHRWLLLILAGFAVGMDVTEGADVGAIFSLLVAAFIVYQALITEGPRIKNITLGLGRLALVVLCAGFLAAQTIHGLISTSIEGVSGTQQDTQTKAQRWDWATQWSLPKTETLGLVVPGLFGFRMNAPDGGEYWGSIGRDPDWEKYLANGQQGPPPTGPFRYTGGGNYVGLLVALVACWTAAQSLRLKNSIFNPSQKKWLWFWSVLSIVSLLLALGRYAPFYQWVYALPYFSTIRNPTKFLYLFSFGLVILFASGVDALWRKYMNPTGTLNANYRGGWWGRASRFEKNWVYGCGLVWVTGLAAWYVYAQYRPELEQYLQSAHLNEPVASIADFSIRQAGWFNLFFFLAVALLILILNGTFTGKRARTGVVLLGLLLVADLGLANRPWVVFWNYKFKYASNQIIDQLRDKPYEHRVTIPPIAWPSQMAVFQQLYKIEWMQHQLPFYNVQTFDVVEMPRIPEDFLAFSKKINDTNAPGPLFHFCRACQLTDTRYILGPADFEDFWNGKLPETPLQPMTRFNIVYKPGINRVTDLAQLTAVPDDYGTYALFELPSALPRAKLYSRWQVNTNNSDVLEQMFNPEFKPENSVFVADNMPNHPATDATNPPDDSVQYVSYAPKDIVLKADASEPSILLLSDHFHPDWKVLVDGAPEKLLRCNFLMRGVYLLPGMHTVEFKFQPPIGLLYVSLIAIVTALVVLSLFISSVIKSRPPVPAPAVVAQPAPPIAPINKAHPKPGSRKKAQRK